MERLCSSFVPEGSPKVSALTELRTEADQLFGVFLIRNPIVGPFRNDPC